MGLREKLKKLTTRAESAAAEHKDEIRQAVEKAEAVADTQTGGKYHDKIETTGGRVNAYLENLDPESGRQSPPAATTLSPADRDPAAEHREKPETPHKGLET